MEDKENKCCALCGASTRKERALLCLCQYSDMYLDHVDEKLYCKHFYYRAERNIAGKSAAEKAGSWKPRLFSSRYKHPFTRNNQIASPIAIAIVSTTNTGHTGTVSPRRKKRFNRPFKESTSLPAFPFNMQEVQVISIPCRQKNRTDTHPDKDGSVRSFYALFFRLPLVRM